MNGYLKLAIAAALLAAGAAGGVFVTANHYEAQLATAHESAKQLELDQAQYKLDLAAESARIKDAKQAAASEASRFWQAKFAAHDEQLAEDKRNEIAARDRTIAALRTGARSLYVAATCPSTEAGGSAGRGGDGVSGAAASAGGGNGATRVRLSVEASEFLVALMAEADQVADQLRATQQFLKDERAKQPVPGHTSPAT